MVGDAITQARLDVLADRILMGEIFARERLIDDRHGRRFGVVGRQKRAAGDHGDVERAEEVGRNDAARRVKLLALVRRDGLQS